VPDEHVTIRDSAELSMSFALQHLERIVRAIPELSLEEVERLTAQADEMRDRVQGIEEAARWRRWRLEAADSPRSGRPL